MYSGSPGGIGSGGLSSWQGPEGELRMGRRAVRRTLGRVAEWSNAPVLKTGVGKPTGGSNPSPTVWLFAGWCNLSQLSA